MTNLQEIYQAWQHNLQFREEFQKNPVLALKNAGFDISPTDLDKIKSLLKLKNGEVKDEPFKKTRKSLVFPVANNSRFNLIQLD